MLTLMNSKADSVYLMQYMEIDKPMSVHPLSSYCEFSTETHAI